MAEIKKDKLGLAGSIAAAVGVSIGGGLWVGPVVASSMAGPMIIAVALLVAIPLFLSLPTYFTLVKSWPVSGAHYHYPAKLLIPENKKLSQLVSWISVWTMTVLGGTITLQYMLVAGAEFTHAMIPSTSPQNLVIIFMTISFIIVYFGIRTVGWMEIILCVILIAALVAILLPGLNHVQIDNLTTSTANTGGVIASFALLYSVSSASFYIIDLGGDVEAAGITVDKAILTAVVANGTAALLIGLISTGIVTRTDLANKTLLFVTQQYLPSQYMSLVGVGALLAGVTSVITLITVYSRYIFATVEEGILPGIIGKKNRFGEPIYFLGLLYVCSLAGISAGLPVNTLASAVALSLLLTFTLVLMVGFRLPTQHPEIFEKESLSDSQLLRPTIVRWSSGITVVINIITMTFLSIHNQLAFLAFLSISISGLIIYGIISISKDDINTNEIGIGGD